MKIWLATLESRNFGFTAMGKTKAAARAALVEGLALHGRQYDCEPNWWEWNGWEDEVHLVELGGGECLRDGDTMHIAGWAS